MSENIKIWTTLPEPLYKEVKEIAQIYGYADAELFRELIRRGVEGFRQLQRLKLTQKTPREPGAILKAAEEIGESINVDDLPSRFKRSWL
ncbi:MAG: hypothetical protein ACTSP4_01475 [Candidatus Hodarchaeales archaeon]